MLSYQHGYHAGNLADVHKHALLAWVLNYLALKDKPLSYIETHAGRGLYRLDTEAARKTGEAAAGIGRLEQGLDPTHPYRRAIDMARAAHGIASYPGSPLIAAHLLRHSDRMVLAELHPQEHAALAAVLGSRATIHRRDGLEMALAVCPPMPRRGVLMVDPSYEVKTDYETLPRFLTAIRRKWNVGVLILWYPILTGAPHAPMIDRLRADHPDVALFESRFAPIRPGHRMTGSGLAVVNPPFGMADEAAMVEGLIRQIVA